MEEINRKQYDIDKIVADILNAVEEKFGVENILNGEIAQNSIDEEINNVIHISMDNTNIREQYKWKEN